MVKVLQISPYFPPQFGGIEQFSYDIFKCLRQHSIEQSVLCYNKKACFSRETVEGISVFRVGCAFRIWSQSIPINYKKVLQDVLSNLDPDIVHIHLPNPVATWYLLRQIRRDKKKRRIVVHWHSDIIRQAFLMPVYRPIQDQLLSICDSIIVTSDNYAKGSRYLQDFRDKITVIPNIVDMERYRDLILNCKARNCQREDSIFFIGVHRKYKGLKYLIEAARLLPHRQFIIAGEGPETNKLKRMARNLHNVIFVGPISEQEKVKYLVSAKVFAFPSVSKNEAFGIALAEALYFGLPAVCFDIEGSGVSWVNQNGLTGFVVPNKDVESFAESIERLMSDEGTFKYLSVNAHNWVVEKMNSEVLWSGIKRVYGIEK